MANAQKPNLAQAIMDLLNEKPVEFSTRAIAAIAGQHLSVTSKRSTVQSQLDRLKKANKIWMTRSVKAPGGLMYMWKSAKWDQKQMTVISLDEAKQLLERGAYFGDVAMLLTLDDQESLRYWFTRTDNIPNLAMRTTHKHSGNSCRVCGGTLVRTGTCETCQDCGDNGGCG